MTSEFDQSDFVELLRNPAAYRHPVRVVDEEQTHISWVFLTGDLVYKLKKAVNFGFLDFSTPTLRKRYCEAEVALNRRLAPDVYLRVEPITLEAGQPAIGGSGPALDWLVVMRQLDRSRLGLAVLERGELLTSHIDALVDQLIPFYESAATGAGIDEYGTGKAFKVNTDENFAQTEDWVGRALPEQRFSAIKQWTNRFFNDQAQLLARRVQAGRIRECHGDLHLYNIFFVDPPVIFDCIEFNERFRCSDIAADLAFLAMDLDFRGRRDLSQHLVQTFVERSNDHGLPEVIDFYRCYRAYVRGKIACFTAADPSVAESERERQVDLARRYFALAHRYTGTSEPPVLMVVFGLMGSGKTSLARFLSEKLAWPAIHSDRVRKDLAGVAANKRVYVPYNQGLYSPEMNRKTFDAMYETAAQALEVGQSVVIDGSFKTHEERDRAHRVAEAAGARALFVHTSCSRQEQRRRLSKRERQSPNGSDGRLELAEKQRKSFEAPVEQGAEDLIDVVTDEPKHDVRVSLLERLAGLGVR